MQVLGEIESMPYAIIGIQGRGWRPGEVREKLSELIARYEDVPKKAAFTYEGPPYGEGLSWNKNALLELVIMTKNDKSSIPGSNYQKTALKHSEPLYKI